MKKNLMSVLILALLVVNLVLTALTMISIVPSAKKSNELITEICSALKLELASGRTANLSSVPIDDLQSYTIADTMTINLRDSEDGSSHYAVLSVVLSMNKADEDYEKLGLNGIELGSYDSNIKSIINDVIRTYTYEEITTQPEQAQKEILEKVQGFFDSSMIVDIGFPTITCE